MMQYGLHATGARKETGRLPYRRQGLTGRPRAHSRDTHACPPDGIPQSAGRPSHEEERPLPVIRACQEPHRADAAGAAPSAPRCPRVPDVTQTPAPSTELICCGSPQTISSAPAREWASERAVAAAAVGPPFTATTTTGRDAAREATAASA